jgi:hypothetical protein
VSIFERWISEIGHPEKKCARVGHDVRISERQAYLYPAKGMWHVADRARFERSYCRRCQADYGEREISRTGLNGLTMDSDRWDALRANGKLWI